MASPSHRDGRRVIYGYTVRATTSPALETMLLIRAVKSQVSLLPGIAISHTTIMEDPGALIVEFTEPEAVTSQQAFFDQLLLLNPRRGVLVTTSSQASWERLLTHQSENKQQPQVLKLSWRTTRKGGGDSRGSYPIPSPRLRRLA